MSSIFEKIDADSNPNGKFWTIPNENYINEISNNLIFQGQLKVPLSAELLKRRSFILTKSNLYYMKKSGKIPKLVSKICWKKVEPFTEESGLDARFGFRLGYKKKFQDFYTDNTSELDDWLDHLSKVAIMSDIEEDYAIIKEIGKGNYAQVYLAQDLGTHEQYAVKNISKEILLHTPRGVQSAISEIDIMRRIYHQNIVNLHKVYESETMVSLVMDYMPAGDLFHRLQKRDRFHELVASKFMINLLEGIQYLHDNMIIHRDLKPENLLMKKADNEFEFKICDFGLSCISGDEQILRCGSPGYVAPEVLYRQPYTSKVDIFGAGVILYIILCGYSPFNGKDIGEILIKNKECKVTFPNKYWKHVSEHGIDLVKRLMNPDPLLRISADEALKHPWFFEHGRKKYCAMVTPLTNDIGLNSIDCGSSFLNRQSFDEKKHQKHGRVVV